MAALGATDVSFSIVKNKKLEDGRRIIQATLTFGDGAKTYPTGGIPISIGKLACPVVIDSFSFDDDGKSIYDFSYDKANSKLVLFSSGQHSHPLILKDASVVDGATTRVNAGTNLLGANTGADITVAGGGANGGVQLNATGLGGSKSELAASVAPAAQTLKVTVIGY